MDEFINSIGKWFKEKTTSPLYGIFIFSVILWNWKFFYVLFWQGEGKLSVPKIEYIQTTILNHQNFWQHLFHFLALPLISTYVLIWWLPIVSNWAHKKHIEFFYKRKQIFDEETLKYENKKGEILSSISEVKKKQAVAKEEIKKNISEEERWLDDYNIFIKSQPNHRLDLIKNVIYSNGGSVYKWSGSQDVRLIDSDTLAVAHTNNLISIEGEGTGEKIRLSDKGKFFLAKFLEDRKK